MHGRGNIKAKFICLVEITTETDEDGILSS